MARRSRVVTIEGPVWDGLLVALADAVTRGDQRELAERLGGLETEETPLQDLSALPVRSCSAVDEEAVLSVSRCTAGRGCPVQDECPLVRDEPGDMGRSDLSRALARAVDAAGQPVPATVAAELARLREGVEQLLRASGRVGPDSPPRARTSIAVLDMAVRRGGVAAATGPFLRAGELEQVAAFVPPGSGRADTALAELEAWLRRTVCDENALVELPGDRSRRRGGG
jgi:hypothetical protein